MAISNAQAYNLDNKLGRRAAKDASLGTTLQTLEAKADATQAVHVKQVQRINVAYGSLTDGVAALFGTAIPDNAIIVRTWYEVTTTFAGDTDDSSTIKIGLEDQDNDVVAAAAISAGGNPWDAGFAEGIQDGTAANYIKHSAARQLAVTWTSNADSALTAGVMDVYVEWVQGA